MLVIIAIKTSKTIFKEITNSSLKMPITVMVKGNLLVVIIIKLIIKEWDKTKINNKMLTDNKIIIFKAKESESDEKTN
jgi:hypothetical protein